MVFWTGKRVNCASAKVNTPFHEQTEGGVDEREEGTTELLA